MVMVNGVGFGFETDDDEPAVSFWGGSGMGAPPCPIRHARIRRLRVVGGK